MIARYDALNRLEKPTLILCNPGSLYQNGAPTRIIGGLSDCEAEELVLNFNATSQLNFRINRIHRDDPDEDRYVGNMFKAVQNRRLIFVMDIGYFMITSIVDGRSGRTQYKDVEAESIDAELQQKTVPYIQDGTYRFIKSSESNDKGILDIIVESLPFWHIHNVALSVAERYRTFEDVDVSQNCLSFLLQNVQDAYECIFIFDIVHRLIDVYDQSDFARTTGIYISNDDVVQSLSVTENAEDLYTAITVMGEDEMTISAINMLGTSTIYNFDYYLEWMTPELRNKIVAWEALLNDADRVQNYSETSLAMTVAQNAVYTCEAEIARLENLISQYQQCHDSIMPNEGVKYVSEYNEAIVAEGGDPVDISDPSDLEAIMAQILDYRNSCVYALEEERVKLVTYQSDLYSLKIQLDLIRSTVSLQNPENFTSEELEELMTYVYEGIYTDEYVAITDNMTAAEQYAQMKTLYDRAVTRLNTVSKPRQEFQVEVDSFIFAKDFEFCTDQLETGCLINVELEQGDVAQLFLTNITVNFDDHNLTMTFGNRFDKYDTKSLFEDALGQINKSANTLNYIKELLYPIKNGQFNAMQAAVQSSRDLSMGNALASTGEEVIIDGSGYTGRQRNANGDGYDARQVKITGKSIVFTNDAWEHCLVAIGEIYVGEDEDGTSKTVYGVNAQYLIGDVIVGNTLNLKDSDGNDYLAATEGKLATAITDISELRSDFTQTANEISLRFTNINDEIDHVTTSTGFTFNEEGMHIHKSNSEITNLINETGMYVTRSSGTETDDNVLTANHEGVEAINLHSRQFLIVGNNSRFEDFDNGSGKIRTGCFYIGGSVS